MKRSARILLTVASVVVSATAVVLWVRNFGVSQGEVSALARHLRWWVLVPLFAMLAVHVALSSWRWSLIERGLGGNPGPFARSFGVGAFALAMGTFLPPPLIYIVCRSVANRLAGTSTIRGAVSGAVDQGADFGVVAMASIPAAIALAARDLQLFLILMGAVAVCAGVVVAALPRIGWVWKATERWNVVGLRDSATLLSIYALSLLRLANLIALTLLIWAACGVGSLAAIVIGVPLITLAISVAMLPGALGVSEWSFSAVFLIFGFARADIITFVLANRLLLTGSGLLLGVLASVAMAASRGRASGLRWV